MTTVAGHWGAGPEPTEPKRTHHRVGWGEYDWPDWRLSSSIGRTFFLHATQRVEPRLLDDLADSLLAPYHATKIALASERYFALRDYLAGQPEPRYRVPATYAPLVTGLRDWCGRWWLKAPWCLERAFETLALWTDVPQYCRKIWALEGKNFSSPVDLSETELNLHDWGWDPIIKTWDQFEEGFLAFVQESLRDYRTRLETLVESRGLVRTPEKREAAEHFAWLARRQLHGDPIQRIATNAGRSWKAVDDAITDCANLIDLPLRPPGKRGRPPKTADAPDNI